MSDKDLGRRDLEGLAAYPAGKLKGVEFAGFLVREEDDAVFIADPQGTWMLPRDGIDRMETWEGGHCIPEDMRATGKPVRVTLQERAVFYEVRPWVVSPAPADQVPAPFVSSDEVRDIFSLGAGKPSTTEGGFRGEMLLRTLERQLTRRLGFTPDICSDPMAYTPGGGTVACGSSATSDQDSNGTATRSDTDADF